MCHNTSKGQGWEETVAMVTDENWSVVTFIKSKKSHVCSKQVHVRYM